jgi:hypothetical protein
MLYNTYSSCPTLSSQVNFIFDLYQYEPPIEGMDPYKLHPVKRFEDPNSQYAAAWKLRCLGEDAGPLLEPSRRGYRLGMT